MSSSESQSPMIDNTLLADEPKERGETQTVDLLTDEQKEPGEQSLSNGAEQTHVLEYSKEHKHSGCFDLHLHHKHPSSHSSSSSSVETRPHAPGVEHKTLVGLLRGLFRSKSESALLAGVHQKNGSPPTKEQSVDQSTTHGPPEKLQKTKRRFMRIVRDDKAPPLDQSDDNAHLTPLYSQSYLESYYANKNCESNNEGGTPSALTLPYVITGHTILKKSLGDRLATSLPPTVGLEHSPTLLKHATFFSEVEVIEYDLKDKVKTGIHYTHYDHIHDDDDDEDDDPYLLEGSKESLSAADCPDLSNLLIMDPDDLTQRLTDEAIKSNENAEKANIFSPIGSGDGASTKHVRLFGHHSLMISGRRSSLTSNDSLSSVGGDSSADEGTMHDFAARVKHIDTGARHKKKKELKRKQKPQAVELYSEWTDGILSCM